MPRWAAIAFRTTSWRMDTCPAIVDRAILASTTSCRLIIGPLRVCLNCTDVRGATDRFRNTLFPNVKSRVACSHSSPSKEWIGVDFDRTLATEVEFDGPDSVGDPIELMVYRVKQWLADGEDVRIFTGRVGPHPAFYKDGRPIDPDFTRKSRAAIEAWCLRVFGRVLPITNEKDFGMKALYDDKAVQVEPNTGRLIGDCASDDEQIPKEIRFIRA